MSIFVRLSFPSALHPTLRDALRRILAARGLVPTEGHGAVVRVSCHGYDGHPWTVIDDEEELVGATELSSALESPVVLLAEHEEMLEASLFRSGKRVDHHEILDGGARRPGSPAAWARALGDPSVRVPLRAAFARQDAASAYDEIVDALGLLPAAPTPVARPSLFERLPALAAAPVAKRRQMLIDLLPPEPPATDRDTRWSEALAFEASATASGSDAADEVLLRREVDRARLTLAGLSMEVRPGLRIALGLKPRP